MFVLVFNDALKQKMLSNGFKKIKEDSNGTYFVLDKVSKFNFDTEDKNNFIFTNKLQF